VDCVAVCEVSFTYYNFLISFIFSSVITIPGLSLWGQPGLVCIYLVALVWLFAGIAIVSDIFMESIEAITATTYSVELWDKEKQVTVVMERQIWNATVANLTLMAFGSSMPEILIAIFTTISTIRVKPSELGPSTIVGSAAFNLLVISGVSVVAVGEEPKAIADMNVFAVTSAFSIFAYLWMYHCVSDQWVTKAEAIWTFIFFFLFVGISYATDKCTAYRADQQKSREEALLDEKKEAAKIAKDDLRRLGKSYGREAVIEVARGMKVEKIPLKEQREIIELIQQIWEVKTASEVEI